VTDGVAVGHGVRSYELKVRRYELRLSL
jgi:hypothetical protein